MARPIAVRLLGKIEVESAAGALLPVPGRRGAALLACLADGDTDWTREQIVALLWPDRGVEQGRASLRQELLRLRRALGLPATEPAERDGLLRFSPELLAFDLPAFCAAAQAGDRDLEALGLYRGELLADVEADASPLGQWLQARRAALQALARDCGLRLLRDADRRGDVAAAESLARRALAVDPATEEAHRWLIRFHADRRDLDAALAQYRACVAALRERHHRAPAPETEALMARVKAALGQRADFVPPDAAGKPSIAVLPFVDPGQSPDEDYFADGVADEIIRLLSRMRRLFVIAANSSVAYRGKAVDTQQAARELGVRYVLQGNTRRTAEQMRISCRLIEAETRTTLWVDRYDGVPADIFALQDKVATSVAAAIEPRIESAEIHRVAARPTTDLTAYDLYLRALPHLYAWERERALTAMALLQQAWERDPNFALALAYGAWCHLQLANNGWARYFASGFQVPLTLADRAYAADPDDPVVACCVAVIRGFFGRDVGACIALIDAALARTPSFAAGWQWSGFLRLFAGEPELAIAHFRQSLRLSPGYDRWNGAGWVGIGMGRFFQRAFAEAASLLERAVDEVPTFASGHRFLAASYAHLGRWDAARQAIERLQRLTPQPGVQRFVFRDPEMRRLYAEGLAQALKATGLAAAH
jgi:TolB-like protein